MENQGARGSDILWEKAFEVEAPTGAALEEAVSGARQGYQIRRWWKYGQPAIDRIKATIDVPIDSAGSLIQTILKAHGAQIQVNLDAFPLGTPFPDIVRLNLELERNIG
jgi:hypothetical protein